MKTQHYSCSLQTAHKIEWWDAFPIIYRAYHWLHIWLCSFLVTHFPAVVIGQHTLSRPCPRYTLSRPYHWLHISLPLALVVTFFRVFSRPCQWLHLFPPPAIDQHTLSRPCHWLHISPPLSLVTTSLLVTCRLHVLHTQSTKLRCSLEPDLLSAGSTLV